MNRREFFASVIAAIVGATRWQKLRHWFRPELQVGDQIGLSVRYIREYDISTDSLICRLDVLSGFGPISTEWECLITAESCELGVREPRILPAGWTYPAPHELLRFHPDAFTFEGAPAAEELLSAAA